MHSTAEPRQYRSDPYSDPAPKDSCSPRAATRWVQSRPAIKRTGRNGEPQSLSSSHSPPVDRMRQVRLLVSVCGMIKNGRWPTLPVVGLSARSSLVTVLDRYFTFAVTCCMCSSVMSPVVAYTIKRAKNCWCGCGQSPGAAPAHKLKFYRGCQLTASSHSLSKSG